MAVFTVLLLLLDQAVILSEYQGKQGPLLQRDTCF